jgi:hypothetical protein
MVHELVLSHVEAPEGDPGGGALGQTSESRPRYIQLANIFYSGVNGTEPGTFRSIYVTT